MNKRHRSPMPLRVKAVTLAVASCFAVTVPSTALANPNGFAVVNGQVTFNYNGTTLTVTNTPGSIINWQRFSIGSNELTRFIQQSAASSVLNRVVGVDPSLILGALQSNGRVFLINPNGILFGAGAQLDVGGLVASTLNLSNQDFLAGRLKFTDTPGAGSVVNRGAITTPTGGQVYLIAPNVQNTGIITSPQGEVILAAGRSVELVDAGTPGLRVELTAPDNEAVNVGQIIANSGKIGIYAGLVRNSGVIRADGVVVGEHGEILLKATQNTTIDAGSVMTANGAHGGNITIQSGDTTLVSGAVEAKGSEGQGGTVQLLGNRVGVIDGAVVDASGRAGGGTVLVGGDYQGRNPDVQNAWRTYVGPNASIHADAIASGDGGKVIVWSDDATRVYGSISARGGAESGSGGFVETSGHSLDVTQGPDVSAPRGAGGTWLLDPVDLNIVAGGSLVNNTAAPFFSPLGDSSSVGVDLINAQLNFGSNVQLTTTSQGPTAGTQAGNITVSAPIVKSAATTTGPSGVFIGTTSLTMQAHNNIVINSGGSITSTGDPLNVTLTADIDGVGGGGVTINGAITTRGGSASVQGRDLAAVNAPINTLSSTGIGGGSVSLTSLANAVQVSSAVKSGSSFSANGFTGVSINAPVTSLSNVQLFSSTGAVTVAAPVSGGFFSASAGGASTLTLAAPVTSTGAALTADDFVITAALNAGSGGITAQQNTSGAPIDLGAGAQAKLDNLITTGPLTIGNFNTGAITINAPLTAALPSAVNLNGASITQNAPVNITGPLSMTTDNVTINNTLTVGGNVTIQQRSFFRPVNLGATADSGTAIDLSAAELNNILTPGALRIGNFSTGAVTIVNPIAPANVGALSLTSGNQITQSVGATVTVANLKLNTSGSVILPQANSVVTLAGSASGFGGQFTFANAAATPLTIGSVDGTTGVQFNNSNGTINLIADNLTVASPISAFFSNGAVVIQPKTATTKLDLGGADAAGTLGISAAELTLISATTLTLKADQADISAPVTSAASTLVIAPITATRQLNIVAGPKNASNLEFLPSEIANISGTTLVLGDSTTGPETVSAVTASPINLTLRSGDTATGITVSSALTANGNLALFSDTMNFSANVTSTSGNISIAANTASRPINLGSKPAATLGLNTTELGFLIAPGTLFVGNATTTGVITLSNSFALPNVPNLNLASNTGVTIPTTTGYSFTGTLAISAPDIAINAGVTAGGDVNLTGDTMTVGSSVTSTGGNINVAPRTSRSITLGTDDTVTTLGFTVAEINNFVPSAAGVLRIGNFTNTNAITVTAAIAPAGTSTLSLLATGLISQAGTGTITETNLRASSSSNSVNLPQANSVGTLAGAASGFGGQFTFANAPNTPLTIGIVDATSGVRFNSSNGTINLIADNMTIANPISAPFSNGAVVIQPAAATTKLNLGGADVPLSPGPVTLGISAAELALISATTLTLKADQADISAPVTSAATTLVIAPLTAGRALNTIVGVKNALSLDFVQADLNNVTAGSFQLGDAATGPVAVSAATAIPATVGTFTFRSGDTATGITVNNPLSANGSLALLSDTMNLNNTVTSTTGNITIAPNTAGRAIDLGTKTAGTLGLNATELTKLSASAGTLFFGNAASGDLTVSAPVTLANSTSLIANVMNINALLTTTAGDITVAPSASRNIALGTNDVVGSTLGFTLAEIDNFKPAGGTGVLRIGDFSNTNNINVTAAITPANTTILSLLAGNSISQTVGSTITETNLRASSFGSVNLTENNSIGTLAGSSSGSFSFTGTGALNIGTVDGAIGISDSTVTIKADTLTLSQPISGGSVTLAPRVAGAPIDLGSKPAGVFGITDAEMDSFLGSVFNLTFGTSTAGPVTVSSAMTRTSGVLNIVTGAAQTVNINAALSAPSGVSVTGGPINVGGAVSSTSGSVTLTAQAPALNVNAPVTAGGNVTLTSDVMNLAAPITAGAPAATPPVSGTVTLKPQTIAQPISLGTENPSALSLTLAEINLITALNLVIGSSTAGPLTVTAPIAPTGATNLSLLSNGAITQNPGATIVTKKLNVNPVTGVTTLTGSLNVSSINGQVNLPEANDVGVFLSGSAGGTNNFVFNNVGPLKLQNVSVFVSATGKTLINAGFFAFVPPAEVSLLELPKFDICALAPEICSAQNFFDNDRFDPDKDKDKNKDADKNKNICGAA